MSQNKNNKSENLQEFKSVILKEIQISFDIFLQEQFDKKLNEFIVKIIEDTINKKFDDIFQKNFNNKITNFLEENFNCHDLFILNKSLERRLNEIKKNTKEKNETS
jgi:hypothetical protein